MRNAIYIYGPLVREESTWARARDRPRLRAYVSLDRGRLQRCLLDRLI